jgi:hypothetical protein
MVNVDSSNNYTDVSGQSRSDCTHEKSIPTLEKYSKIRPATAREDSIKLTNYQWHESQTIDSAWVEIKTLRRRVVNANPLLDNAYNENAMLQFLLPALPKEYAVTIATLDAQPTLSV